MRFRILLATVALLGSLCAACSSDEHCATGALMDIADSYVRADQNDQALQIAQTIDNSVIKANVLSRIAVKYGEAGQENQAEALFTQALQMANKIESLPEKAVTLETIATRYGKVGQNDKAAEVLSQASQVANTIGGASFVKDTVIETIAVRYAEIGDYNQGIGLANTIEDSLPKSRALARIVVKYVAVGNYDEARQIADTIEFNASKANALIEIAKKTKEYEQALSAAKEIENEQAELKINILGKISLLYAEAQQKQQTIEALSQALQVVKTTKDTETQVSQLAKIALLYLKTGNQQQASNILSQVLQVADTIENPEKKANTLAKVAVAYADAGQKKQATLVFTQAQKVAQTIENDENKNNTLARLAIASTKIKPYDQVLQLTQTLRDTRVQSSALIQIANDYVQTGHRDLAAKVLTQVLQNVQTLEDTDDKDQKLDQIAVQYAKITQYEQAIAVAKKIRTTNNGSPKASVLAKIANSYVEAGQKDKAMEVLSQALQVAKGTKCL